MKRLAATIWLVCGCLQVWGGYPSPPGHQHNHHNQHSKHYHHHDHHIMHHHNHHHHHHSGESMCSGGDRKTGAPWTYDEYAPSVVRVKRKAADSTQLWPDGIVPYVFLSPEPRRDVVLEGLNHWEERTCLRFVPVNDTNLPHLQFRKLQGCRSGVGIESSRGQNISIGSNCNKMGIVVHEVGHAVGLYHEIRRPDRDEHVVVNEANILREELFNFFKLHWLDVSIQYDLSSVMHYHTLEWTSNDRTTVATRDPMLQGLLGTWKKEQQGLSHRDSIIANKIYGCLDDWLEKCNLNRNPCENDGYMGSECICVCPPGTQGRTCQNVTGGYYDHLKSTCSMEVTQPTTITSPNYPSTYDEGTWCVFRIEAPKCQAPQITILDFELGPRDFRDFCFYDYLEIRNTSLHDGFLVCGSEVEHGTIWTSSFSTMIVYFKGEGGGFRGFKASVTFVSISGCCRSYSNATLAYFLHTPGYPNPYTAAFNCSYSLPQQDAPAQLVVRVVRQGGKDTSAPPWTCALILCQPHGRCRRYCSEPNQKTKVRRSHRGEKESWVESRNVGDLKSRRRRGRRSYRKLRRVGWIEVEEHVEEEDKDGDAADDGGVNDDGWSVVLPNVASPHLLQYLGDADSSFRSEGAAYQVSFSLKQSPCHQVLFVNRSDPRGRVRVKAEEEEMLQCEWWFQAPRGGHIKFTVEELSLPPDEDSYLVVNEAGEASYPAQTTRVYQHGGAGERRQDTPPPLVSIDHELSVVLQGMGPNTSLTFKYELYECGDDNVECPYWAVEGECDLNPRWMKPHCPRSCLRCDYTRRCEDDNSDCKFWAENDQCTENSVWMAVHCSRACGYCDRCGDANFGCMRWAARGECHRNTPYMATFCRKACGFCEEETVNATTSATTTNSTSTTPSQGNHTTPINTPPTTWRGSTTPRPPKPTTASPRLHITSPTIHPSTPSGRRKTTARNDEENETTHGITSKPRKYKRKYKHKTPQPSPHPRKKVRVRIRGETTEDATPSTVTWPTSPMLPETDEADANKRRKIHNNGDVTRGFSRKHTRLPTTTPTFTSLTKEKVIHLDRSTPIPGATINKTMPSLEVGTTNSVEEGKDEEHHLPTPAAPTGTKVTSGSPYAHKTVTPNDVSEDIEEPKVREKEEATTENLKNEYNSYGLNQRQNSLDYEDRECGDGGEDTEGWCREGPDWTSTTRDEKAFIMGLIRSHRREESTTGVTGDNDVIPTKNAGRIRNENGREEPTSSVPKENNVISTPVAGRRRTDNVTQSRPVHRRRKHRHRGKGNDHSGKRKVLPNQRHRKHNRTKHIRKRGRWRTRKQNPRGKNVQGGRGNVTRSSNKEIKQQQAGGRENTRKGQGRRNRHKVRGEGKGNRRGEKKISSQVNRHENKRKWRAERKENRRGRGNRRRNNTVHRRRDDNDAIFEPRPGEVPRWTSSIAATTTQPPPSTTIPSLPTSSTASITTTTSHPLSVHPTLGYSTIAATTAPPSVNDKHKKPRQHNVTGRRRIRKKKRRPKSKLQPGEKDKRRRSESRQRHRRRRKQRKLRPSSTTQHIRNDPKHRQTGNSRSLSLSYPNSTVTQRITQRRRNRITFTESPIVRASGLASPNSTTTLPHPSPMSQGPPVHHQPNLTLDPETQMVNNKNARAINQRSVEKSKELYPAHLARKRKIGDDLYPPSVWAKAADLTKEKSNPRQVESLSQPPERYAEWGIGPIKPSHQTSRQVTVLPWWRFQKGFYRRGQDVYEDIRGGAGEEDM